MSHTTQGTNVTPSEVLRSTIAAALAASPVDAGRKIRAAMLLDPDLPPAQTSLRDLARRLGCSHGHLMAVLGGRESARLRGAVAEYLGFNTQIIFPSDRGGSPAVPDHSLDHGQKADYQNPDGAGA